MASYFRATRSWYRRDAALDGRRCFMRLRSSQLFAVQGIMPDMNIAEKLADLGWTLPAPAKPVGAYVPAVRTGNLLFVSGQLPLWSGKLMAEGKVPSEINVEMAKKAAAQCAVNALAIVGSELDGDWSRLVRVVRMGLFVQ